MRMRWWECRQGKGQAGCWRAEGWLSACAEVGDLCWRESCGVVAVNTYLSIISAVLYYSVSRALRLVYRRRCGREESRRLPTPPLSSAICLSHPASRVPQVNRSAHVHQKYTCTLSLLSPARTHAPARSDREFAPDERRQQVNPSFLATEGLHPSTTAPLHHSTPPRPCQEETSSSAAGWDPVDDSP